MIVLVVFVIVFQSPSHRGGGAAQVVGGTVVPTYDMRFNPLLIGEAAPPYKSEQGALSDLSFNPLLIGEAAPPA